MATAYVSCPHRFRSVIERPRPGPAQPRNPRTRESGDVFAVCLLAVCTLQMPDLLAAYAANTAAKPFIQDKDEIGLEDWTCVLHKCFDHCSALQQLEKALEAQEHEDLGLSALREIGMPSRHRVMVKEAVKHPIEFFWDMVRKHPDQNVQHVYSVLTRRCVEDSGYLADLTS